MVGVGPVFVQYFNIVFSKPPPLGDLSYFELRVLPVSNHRNGQDKLPPLLGMAVRSGSLPIDHPAKPQHLVKDPSCLFEQLPLQCHKGCLAGLDVTTNEIPAIREQLSVGGAPLGEDLSRFQNKATHDTLAALGETFFIQTINVGEIYWFSPQDGGIIKG